MCPRLHSLILLFFIALFFAFKIKVNQRILETLLVLSFLLFFEFILLFVGVEVDKLSGGFPVVKLGINAILAYSISFASDIIQKNTLKRFRQSLAEVKPS